MHPKTLEVIDQIVTGSDAAEELPHAIGRGVGRDVIVLGIQSQQHVADGAAGEVGGVAVVAEAPDNGESVFAQRRGFGGFGR